MPPVTPDPRARIHRTILGKVIYKREKHEFRDQDIYRITRALFIQQDDVKLGPWLANLFLTLLRLVFDWVKDTKRIKEFLLSFIFSYLPGLLQIALKYEDVYYKLLKGLWLWIGDVLAGAKPAKDEPLDLEEE